MERLRLFGTPAEERFDRLTRLACRLFGVAVSMVDIIGSENVWIKSSAGPVDMVRSPTRDSYCYYAVSEDRSIVIPDARLDPRTSDNRYAGAFVFYAGVPLRYDSNVIGVFCISDGSPRTFDEAELSSLQDIAALAETEIRITSLSESQMNLLRENEELAEQAQVDSLTKVWNRGAIEEILRNESNASVIMMDLDHFKKINDTYGHPGGDEVLRVITSRLRGLVKPWDAIGRYGGEEFLIVVSECDIDDVGGVAERFRVAISEAPISFNGKLIHVTASFGAGETIGDADAALYRAKAQGRNRVEVTREHYP